MTGAFFEWNCLNWGKSACLSAAVVIFHEITSEKRLPLCLCFFLSKLAKFLSRNFIQDTGSILKHLIQRTGCCTEVMWLLVQTHHSIRCSHKRYKNSHFGQHMIFWYSDEGSGEPLQTCRLPRAFSSSTRDIDTDTYRIVQWLSAQMCRLTRVFAAGVNSTQIAI